jgi:glycosyltransferase involved in cell wall biosynthesis
MKITFPIGASAVKGDTTAQSAVKVCMHVLRRAHTDYRAMRTATALVTEGFEVFMIDVEAERTVSAEEAIDGVCMKHIIMPSWFTSRRFEPWFFVTAVRTFILSLLWLIRIPADIYHADEVTALPACYIAARLRRKPLIFEAYDLLPAETNIAFWRRLDRLVTRFLAWVVPRCAGVITVSLPIAQEMQQRYHGPEVTVIRSVPTYRAVTKSDRLRQQLGLSPNIRLALYQGGLQPNRGLDRLIRAAPFLASDIVIVLMGKDMGKTQAQLETLIASEGVTDRVKIVPPVPYAELLDWTASADIGLNILPPDYSLSIKWCLPNKLFEYLMAGLPVLTSELDAVVEVIRTYDVGQIVSSLAPADVGAAINTMLADRVALARMRRNALEAAQQDLCWEKESRRLIHLYHDILAVRDAEGAGQSLLRVSHGDEEYSRHSLRN